MVLVRVRVTSFLCGFATAGALAMYQLRADLTSSTDFLATQVCGAFFLFRRRRRVGG